MGLLYEVGDIVTLKKTHPCGSKEWEILRVGADFRLKCQDVDTRSWCRGKWWKKSPKICRKKKNKALQGREKVC